MSLVTDTRIRDLLERERNGEITPTEKHELDRAGLNVTAERREWSLIADALGEESDDLPQVREAQLAQDVMRGLRLREPDESQRVPQLRWGALIASGVALGFMVALWVRPEVPEVQVKAAPPVSVVVADTALVSSARPVEVEVQAVDENVEPPLVTVTF